MEKQYRTLTGRRFDLGQLADEERAFLDEIASLYRKKPDWNEFARTWMRLARARLWKGEKAPVGSPVYRICQDMEARLGITEGRVASPDYRDRLADLIEERYGSRYAFCKAAGIDQGNLSKVLSGARHLSPDTLFKVLEHLQVEIEFVGKDDVYQEAVDPFAGESVAQKLAAVEHHIATLRNLQAMAESYPDDEKATLLDDEGLFRDGLEQIRVRVKAGEDFDQVISEALAQAYEEKSALGKEITADADAQKRVAG